MNEAGQLVAARGFEEALRAKNVDAQEGRGVLDAAIDVGFSGKVQDGVGAKLKGFFHCLGFDDVAVQKGVARVFGDVGVGELVEIDDLGVLPGIEEQPDEIGTNETAPSVTSTFTHNLL